YGILVILRVGRVAAEQVEDGPAVVEARGYLTVRVIGRLAAWICQSLDLVALGEADDAKVRIAVAGRWVVGDMEAVEPSAEPGLKVDLLVPPARATDELPTSHRLLAGPEDLDDERRGRRLPRS